MKKISNNPSSKEMIELLNAFENLEALYKHVPFARNFLPNAGQIFTDLQEIKKQSELLFIPDRFNENFSQMGWIAYESMNIDVMIEALERKTTVGIEDAEQLLADHYDQKTLDYGIIRFHSHPEFRKRLRLIELARTDYLAGRFHACVPLLLSIVDGLVNDISKSVGFFADSVDMTAWDSIAAHETGLSAIAKIMRSGRNKTNEEPISIPFRNGILHGRDLAFDNKLVAAKCWSTIFAVRDWANSVANSRNQPQAMDDFCWSQLFIKATENKKIRNALEAWKPRQSEEVVHLPSHGPATSIREQTPERIVAEFIENWEKGRYGLMAELLVDFSDIPKGKRSGRTKRDFGSHKPISYTIIGVTDESAAISQIEVEIVFEKQNIHTPIFFNIRTVYQSSSNDLLIRGEKNGSWKIVQNSFGNVIYGSSM
ncbi:MULTISPECIES: hypothetical protein [Delftia]|uniref:Uncharacterized protein n=1 Tax=Delftia acidovorans TaxID=80866 RepID=A0AAJ2R020_DELAC|nr:MULTISPECIES: hypothetical protein [Delftia]MDX4953443.1 hypothetical protein [Delftia acidovorans]MXN31402.1 hypothetical protein [Delftia sp. CH05]